MTTFGFLSLLPPLMAILLAIRTRQVIFSLLIGLLLGYLLLNDWNPIKSILGTLDALVLVFKSEGNTRTVLFTLLIGALIQLIRISGGVEGFIFQLQKRLESAKNPEKSIQYAAGITGFLLFIESNISILTVGTAFRPLFEKYGIAKEKLAYLADSSSAPSCILFPVNAWGAYIMGLLLVYPYLDPFKMLVYSIPLNFYAVFTLIFVFIIIRTGKSFGPMQSFEFAAKQSISTIGYSEKPTEKNAFYLMLVPLAIMVVSMPIFLMYTGWQSDDKVSFFQSVWFSISNGSGSQAVLYAVSLSLIILSAILLIKKKLTIGSLFEEYIKGMNDMLVMAILMVLAFAIGELCHQLGTGQYVASITSPWLSPSLAPFLLFLTSCFVAFATGTSWGTFAIMISIAMPLAQTVGVNPYLALAAVLGGGVFGDHCSPISDTTLIASMASGSEHINHVRTQLPYALITGVLAAFAYLLAGFLL